jgi:hypothetical protein
MGEKQTDFKYEKDKWKREKLEVIQKIEQGREKLKMKQNS